MCVERRAEVQENEYCEPPSGDCQGNITVNNKCIGDDTKAAVRQSLNCIKNKQKIKYGKKRFSICRMEFLYPTMWHDHDIDFVR